MHCFLTRRDVEHYLCFLHEQERAPATLERYRRDLARLLAFVGRERLSKDLLMAFKTRLCQEYAPGSVNSMLAAVNGLLGFVGRADLRVRRLRIQRPLFCPAERELTRAEYGRLVAAARQKGNDRLHLLLQTLAATGIRVGELRWITREAAATGKANVTSKGKTRLVMLPRRLCTALTRYCAKRGILSGPVFRTASGRPLDRSNIWGEMKCLCRGARVSPQKVFPHNLRHLFARTFYSMEKDISRLADVLGHSSVETTRLYIVSSGSEHERQLSQLHLLL